MTQIDYDKLPVKYIMENEILSDIFYPDDTLNSKMSRVRVRLENSDYRNFFMVIVDNENNKFLGIITFDEFIGLMKNKKYDYNKKFRDIMNKKFPCLDETKKIKDVFDFFESNKDINIIPILNKEGKYIGKIRRTNFKKRIEELFKSLAT